MASIADITFYSSLSDRLRFSLSNSGNINEPLSRYIQRSRGVDHAVPQEQDRLQLAHSKVSFNIQALPAYLMSHYVYLVQCADGTLYTGYAKDVQQRVAVHNTGKGARYTRSRLPVSLLAFWHFPTQSAALKREYQIKQLTRHQKLALTKSSVPFDIAVEQQ